MDSQVYIDKGFFNDVGAQCAERAKMALIKRSKMALPVHFLPSGGESQRLLSQV